jgi:hypothetical protein
MMNLLKYIDARLGESSTWSALAALSLALHVNVDPGLWKALSIWGSALSGALGFLIAENTTGKPSTQIAQDILTALVAITNKQGPKA